MADLQHILTQFESEETKPLTLAQELRAAISGVILGIIELKFAYFLDHDDLLRQNKAEEYLKVLLEHLDDKLTELTGMVATDPPNQTEPSESAQSVDRSEDKA